MRFKFRMIVGLLMAMGIAAMADEPRQISLRTIGEVSPELTARIVSWVSENIAPVKDDGALKTKGKTLSDIAQDVQRPKNVQAVLVLVNQLDDSTRRVVGGNGVVVLNLGLMRPADLSTEAAKETFIRRVEKESIGGLAAVYGLPVCPFVQCAAYSAKTVADLDEMSRNLCPPCMGKLAEIMEQGSKVGSPKSSAPGAPASSP